jgi:PKD repeat protein
VKRPLNTDSTEAVCCSSIAASCAWRASLLTLLVAFVITLATPRVFAQAAPVPPQARPPFPSITLPQRAQGEAALARLGNRLPEVAAWYGLSVPQFANMLRFDRTAWLDRQGRVYFEEEVRLPPQTATAPQATDPLSPDLEPLDQTFKLHSRPGARRTVYLNFAGATLTGTAWNQSSGQSTITAQPFDLDGLPYSFSSTELQRIQYIWKRVAEDYSAFDVNVTTEPPPADKLSRSSSSDDTFGTTVLITRRTFYNCSCGGVAYLTVFDDVGDYYKPALVFFDALGSGNEKYVADAISHEAGHNVGLGHDGTSSTGYYTGHGSGATGWAPIMGVGYYQQLVQWSKGEYAGANNKQDDYVVMQATGLPIRSDDHGNTTAAATPLASSTVNGVTALAGSGLIERPSDVDAFSFVAGAGAVTINVSPAPRGPKLDIVATLRDGAGNVLATSNPIDSLPATLTATLSVPGTYFVTVDGIGKGDPLGTGYTDYGSVGQYTISGTAQASTQQPPLAVISATPTSGTAPLSVNFSAAGSADADGSIVSYTWNFGDGSSQTGTTTTQYIYNSPGTYNATLTVTDNAGLTSTKAVTITAGAPVSVTTMSVTNIAMSLRTYSRNRADALASISVRDSNGNPVPGATVSGSWSGVVSGNASLLTNSSGKADFRSARVTAPAGSVFTFTVTGISLSGYAYDASKNAETSGSITR